MEWKEEMDFNSTMGMHISWGEGCLEVGAPRDADRASSY